VQRMSTGILWSRTDWSRETAAAGKQVAEPHTGLFSERHAGYDNVRAQKRSVLPRLSTRRIETD
jgi:hypothetical protein